MLGLNDIWGGGEIQNKNQSGDKWGNNSQIRGKVLRSEHKTRSA